MDRYDIEARTDGDPKKDTKNQMRLMMRSLLADRFKLKTHYETRRVSVYTMELVKADKTGPQLQLHSHSEAESPCAAVLAPGSPQGVAGVVAGGYPTQCGGVLPMTPSAPERLKVGARNVAMDFLEKQLPALGQLERPLVDGTGLSDALDFTPEWVPDVTGGSPPTPDFSPDPNGPSFSPALKDQLGLKLNSQKGTSEALIIDPPGTAERELKPFLHRAATIIHVIHVFGSAGRGQGAHAPSIAIPRFAAHRSHARDIQPGSAVIPSALSGGPRVR